MGYKDIAFLKGTKFLVTGCAGFIGSSLVEAILNLGYHVRGLDNFSTGKRENIDIYYSLAKVLNVNIEPKFGAYRKGDIRHSNADIIKEKKLLGYDPEYDFARGLNEAIVWYKEDQ